MPDFPYSFFFLFWFMIKMFCECWFWFFFINSVSINIVYIIRRSVKWCNALYDQTYDRVNSKMYALVVCNSEFENFEFKKNIFGKLLILKVFFQSFLYFYTLNNHSKAVSPLLYDFDIYLTIKFSIAKPNQRTFQLSGLYKICYMGNMKMSMDCISWVFESQAPKDLGRKNRQCQFHCLRRGMRWQCHVSSELTI